MRISDGSSDVCSSDLRIGRTARAGASGVAISFCADDERPYLRDIERVTRQKVTIEPLPADFVAQSHEIQATRKKAIGADPDPREDRQPDPRRPRATDRKSTRLNSSH